jgi:flagellar basal body rod protein FlgC
LGLATLVASNSAANDTFGKQDDQQYHEVASVVLADMEAQRNRLLARWKGGVSRNVQYINPGYSQSRYTPKYGRRYSSSFGQSLDEGTNTQGNNVDIPCINLANMKYTKHKKSKSYYQHDVYYKSSKSHESVKSYTVKEKGAHDSKSKSTSKSKSQSQDDYCDDEHFQEIQCTANIVDFASAVELVFDGNPQFLTGPEQLALEHSFRETYNGNKINVVVGCRHWCIPLMDLTSAMPA